MASLDSRLNRWQTRTLYTLIIWEKFEVVLYPKTYAYSLKKEQPRITRSTFSLHVSSRALLANFRASPSPNDACFLTV